MEIIFILIAALLPVAILLMYIYKKDSEQPEPKGWLAKAFIYGAISAPLSMCISFPLCDILGIDTDGEQYTSILDAFINAFCSAAIPEEVAKLLMLWLLLRKNPHFDEKFDGIVYAVCVGLGFAGLENILYLLDGDGWIGTGIARALFAVPGHMLFGVLMGYFYSLHHFSGGQDTKAKYMILLAPIIAHGVYDGILFSLSVDEELSAILIIGFLWFFNKLRKKGQEKINELVGK